MKRFFYIALMCSLFLAACDSAEPVLENDELIFSDSYPIRIPEYDYTDPITGISYHMRGDEGSNYSSPDTISGSPVFLWRDFNYQILSMAVFTQPIQVSEGEITNSDAIVWQWHTGMQPQPEIDSIIQYSSGRNVLNSEIDYDAETVPLAQGHYFWAVWGWGSSGTRILYSSMPLEFYVQE